MAQFDVMRPYYMMWTSKEIFLDLRSTFRFLFSQLLYSQKKGGGGGGRGNGANHEIFFGLELVKLIVGRSTARSKSSCEQ